MTKKLPKIIEEVGFDFNWSEKKVWVLNIPVEKINIKELEWHFEIPFWNTKNGNYDLKPNNVINFPKNHQEEYYRTMKSDLSYPIDIMENKGRWLILDGLHRLVKAKMLGKNEIEVRKVPRSKIAEIEK
jgi:hypothetical protein